MAWHAVAPMEGTSMKIAVLGTGAVGRAVSAKLDELGHDVVVGTRDVDALREREDAAAWLAAHPAVTPLTFRDAAGHGDVVVLATGGGVALDVLDTAGAPHLAGKVLLDITNPLDFSGGFPPRLSVVNDDSLAEQIQRTFPDVRVVKTLNTVNASLMVDPGKLAGGSHTVFVSGNDAEAKQVASDLLTEFGWTDILDLGDLSTARGTEMWLALWVRLMQVQGTAHFNLKIVREP